jgi:hypothetical protein
LQSFDGAFDPEQTDENPKSSCRRRVVTGLLLSALQPTGAFKERVPTVHE